MPLLLGSGPALFILTMGWALPPSWSVSRAKRALVGTCAMMVLLWQPALSPLVTIITIRDYRRHLLRPVLEWLRRKGSGTQASTTPTPAARWADPVPANRD